MKSKTVLLHEFQCPKCKNRVLVAYCRDETSVICPACKVWMQWMGQHKRKVLEGSDVHAGDHAFPEEASEGAEG